MRPTPSSPLLVPVVCALVSRLSFLKLRLCKICTTVPNFRASLSNHLEFLGAAGLVTPRVLYYVGLHVSCRL